jgi:hypothetical protein
MSRVRVYSWYGYIGAPFPRGVGYSRGLDMLGEKLAALPGVTVAPGVPAPQTTGAISHAR